MTHPFHVTYDPQARAAYIYLAGPIAPGGVSKTVEGAPGINLDFDAQGHLIGIEFLSPKLLHPDLAKVAERI